MKDFTKYLTKELLLSIFIVVILAVTLNVLKQRSQENFEDGELISLQNFKTIVAKGDAGIQGPKGDVGSRGDTGQRGPAGVDSMQAIKTQGKMWLGSLNAGKAGNDLDGETQLYLGGAHNSGANNGREGHTTYKLMIEGYDNNGSTVYPIMCKDKNGLVDLSLKNREKPFKKPELYLAGDLKLGNQSMIHSQGTLRIHSNKQIKLISKNSDKGVVISKEDTGNGHLRVEGKLDISNVIDGNASGPTNTASLHILEAGTNDIVTNFKHLELKHENNTLILHSDKEVFNTLTNTNNPLKLDDVLVVTIMHEDKEHKIIGHLSSNISSRKIIIKNPTKPKDKEFTDLVGNKKIKVTRHLTDISDVSNAILKMNNNLIVNNDLEVNGKVYFKNVPSFGDQTGKTLNLSSEEGLLIKKSDIPPQNKEPILVVDSGDNNQNHMRVKSNLYLNKLRYLNEGDDNSKMFGSEESVQPMYYTELTDVGINSNLKDKLSGLPNTLTKISHWTPIISSYTYSEELARAIVPNITTGTSSRTGAHTHTVPGYTIDMPQGVYFIKNNNEWQLQLDAPSSIQSLPSIDKKLSKLNILWIRNGLFLQ